MMLAKIGPGHEANAARSGRAILFDHFGADDVRRHQVRRELDAAELQVHRLGERLDQQRLGQARHAAQQAMPAGQEGGEDFVDHLILPDDHAAKLFLKGTDQGGGLGQTHLSVDL